MLDVLLLFIPLFLLPSLLVAFLTFNRLLEIEQRQFEPQWIQGGRPRGWFQRKEPNGSLREARAKYICTLKWLFYTPGWVRESRRAMHLLWRYRLSVLVWNAGLLLWIFLVETLA
jgi:hypothetical protein